ncbi:G protein pathway suppressor 2-like [Poecile atricapillus]|uniref:G protein pathway suppressor 2-like n=1 Tax=Poecile atricapillus TaxID=48891 RepID=UPI002738E04F|nr:G protein pathway suppressor 2-like [Poecile atricapillus]
MPALLERPKLSSAMARALHRHVMVERERKRQEEEEVDKMMEQKVREEQERRRRKELEERMSLEETREQLLKLQEKLGALQEEKHQLFLQLKKVLHEEEKRRRKEQSDLTTLTAAAYPQSLGVPGAHLLGMTGSPGGPPLGAHRGRSSQANVRTPRDQPAPFWGSAALWGRGGPRSFWGGPGGSRPRPLRRGAEPRPSPTLPPRPAPTGLRRSPTAAA